MMDWDDYLGLVDEYRKERKENPPDDPDRARMERLEAAALADYYESTEG